MAWIDTQGYRRTSSGRKGSTKAEHIVIAEAAMGKTLPVGAEVHHVDENKANNAPSNLVICPDRAYHQLLHRRMRALEACGHADWRKCHRCGQYDKPENLHQSAQKVYHAACNRAHVSAWRAKKAGY